MKRVTPVPIVKKSIQSHYDLCSGLYARLWGEHIHHGYWNGAESADRAQVQLIECLAKAAEIPCHAHVLDAGCGLGGSSLWLANNFGCRVTGVTLSPVQSRVARRHIQRAGFADRVDIQTADLESLDFPSKTLDVVWSVECTEHLMDKAAFIQTCQDWTKQTQRTWELCIAKTNKWWVRAVAWVLGKEVRQFVRGFPVILDAYRTGAMQYTMIVGRSAG